ncbi:MAG: hypothetical protein Q9226_007065 [Calogaya cf. arnoldii]
MIIQTHRALARQCLDKHRLRALTFNLTRVALRQPYLGRQEATDIPKPALQTSFFHRSYATAAVSRPKAHTGRTTTSPRKKSSAVKTTAPAKGVKKAAATTKPAAKKTNSKAKPKPAPKKAASKKSATKPRTKAKSTKARTKSAKAKATKAKAKPAKKQKKVLKPEEKERLKERLVINELKAKALSPPKRSSPTAFSALLAEKQREVKSMDLTGSIAKDCSKQYHAFTAEQREHYNHIANQNKASDNSKYQEWILTYSPAEILEANNARIALRKRKVPGSWKKLRDERLVRRPRTSFMAFRMDRHRSGDFTGVNAIEAGKRIGAEWRELSDSDKKPFVEETEKDLARYEQEVKAVYNRGIRHKKVERTVEA